MSTSIISAKKHLLFTCLERHGIAGPSKVMWGKDDQIRELLKDLSSLCARPIPQLRSGSSGGHHSAAAANSVHEMIYKEEQILLPICLERWRTSGRRSGLPHRDTAGAW
jgi:DUF438 domain-containing protein